MANHDVRPRKKLVIYCNGFDESGWKVQVGVEEPQSGVITYHRKTPSDDGIRYLKDPWTRKQYEVNLSPEASSISNMVMSEDEEACSLFHDYGKKIFRDLELDSVLLGYDCDRVAVHEDIQSDRRNIKSIQSLLWEVFEDPEIWSKNNKSANRRCIAPRITRVVTGQSVGTDLKLDTCHILLVVSRSFQYTMSQSNETKPADYSPGLIQNTLLQIMDYLEAGGVGSRFSLDVVRPGTYGQLRAFLQTQKEAGRKYDLVHFDLHGSIKNGIAKLRFSKPWNPDLRHLEITPQTPFIAPKAIGYEEVDIETVAELLREYKVPRVAMNACLSASTKPGTVVNMAQVLIQKGVTSVSAMSYELFDSTAKSYYDRFYNALILEGKGFHEAAAEGREALRKSEAPRSQWANKIRGEWLYPLNWRNRVRTFSNRFRPHDRTTWLFTMLFSAISFVVFLAYLFACPWPRGYDLLTFYKIIGFYTTIGSLIFSMAFLRQPSLIDVLEATRFLIDRIKRVAFGPSHCAQFQSFHAIRPKTFVGDSEFEPHIEHMIIEDRLFSEKKIYLWGVRDAHVNETVRALVPIWIRTGFLDSAVIKDAMDFVEVLSRPWATTHLPRPFLRTRRSNGPGGGPGTRHLVVVKNIDLLLEKLDEWYCGVPYKDTQEIQKLNSWMQSHVIGDSYILITGTQPDGWWEGWSAKHWGEAIKMWWGSAQPHRLQYRRKIWGIPGSTALFNSELGGA